MTMEKILSFEAYCTYCEKPIDVDSEDIWIRRCHMNGKGQEVHVGFHDRCYFSYALTGMLLRGEKLSEHQLDVIDTLRKKQAA